MKLGNDKNNLPSKIFELNFKKETSQMFTFTKTTDEAYLVFSVNQKLIFYKTSGENVLELSVPIQTPVLQISFDLKNEYLAILTANQIFIQSFGGNLNQLISNAQKIAKISEWFEQIETEGAPSVMAWSKNEQLLAIGTVTGSIIFYQAKLQKRVSTVGKHSKKVLYLDWAEKSCLLASVAEDKGLVISKPTSETVEFSPENNFIDANEVHWMPNSKNNNKERIILCVNKQKKGINFVNLDDIKQNNNITFNVQCGKSVAIHIIDGSNICIVFSKGYFARYNIEDFKVSEIFNERIFNSAIEQAEFSKTKQEVFIAGEGIIKSYSINKPEEIKRLRINFDKNISFEQIFLCSDSKTLGVSVSNGFFYWILLRVENKVKFNQGFFVRQTSYNQISVKSGERQIEFEVSGGIDDFCIQNRSIYILQQNQIEKYDQKGSKICTNQNSNLIGAKRIFCFKNYYTLTFQNKLVSYKYNDQNDNKPLEFEFQNSNLQIESDQDFIYILSGRIFRIIENSKILFQKEFQEIFTKFSVSKNSLNIILFNETDIFYFQPNENYYEKIDLASNQISNVINDQEDDKVFIVCYDKDKILTIRIQKNTPHVKIVKEILTLNEINVEKQAEPSITIIEQGIEPITLENGSLFCLEENGLISNSSLSSHSYLYKEISNQKQEEINELLLKKFYQSFELKYLKIALDAAEQLKDNQIWQVLLNESLNELELDIAEQCYKQLNDIGSQMLLKEIRNNCGNNINELRGDICILQGNYELAEKQYQKCCNLDKLIDLLAGQNRFEEAIQQSRQKNQKKLPKLLLDYAELTFKSEQYIKTSGVLNEITEKFPDYQEKAIAIKAKIALAQGNSMLATELLKELKSNETLIDLAEIATELDCPQLSFAVYNQLNKYELALNSLLQFKNKTEAENQAEIILKKCIQNINNPILLQNLAKFFEFKPQQAEVLYIKSGNFPEYFKFLISQNKNPEQIEQAFLNHCPNSQSVANILADYFLDIPSKREKAIKFYVIAGRNSEAFQKAIELGLIDIYSEIVKDYTPQQAGILANYYLGRKNYQLAGKFFALCDNYESAILNMIKAKNYDQAVDYVVKVKNEELFDLVIQIFAGNADIEEVESNSDPVDPIYLFKLYLKWGKISNAEEIASAIVEKELEAGNYKQAFGCCNKLCDLLKNPSFDLMNKTLILHSYSIARKVLKNENHFLAAQLLNRVCGYIQYFPKHCISIMTSTVIEATKAGLKQTAYNWAIQLCKPENRSNLDLKFKDRIEKIALKPINEKDQEIFGKCILCSTNSSYFDITCKFCFNKFLICIASGKAILAGQDMNFDECGNCKGIAYSSELNSFFKIENLCPYCEKENLKGLFNKFDLVKVKNRMKDLK